MRRLSFAAGLLAVACGMGSTEKAPSGDDPLHIGDTVHTATFDQRDTQVVPDTMGRLSIALGDVEGVDLVERVELIDNKDGAAVLSTMNMRVGATKRFKIDRTKYKVELVATDSSHVLHDTATFTFSKVR